MWNLSESETGSEEDVPGKRFAHETAAEKPYAPSRSACQERPKAEKTEWSDNLHVSPATVHHTEAVFSTSGGLRTRTGRPYDLDVNMAIWGIYLNDTLRAAVHLGKYHDANLPYVKNQSWNSVGLLFHETGKLISEQNEITGTRTIDFQDATWMQTSLLCEKTYRFTNAKTYVVSDSVRCV